MLSDSTPLSIAANVLASTTIESVLRSPSVSVRPTHLPGPDAKGDGVHLI